MKTSLPSDFTIDNYLAPAASEIYYEENNIDHDREIYLITFCPDPSRLPDSDPSYQHRFNVNILSDYLKYCYCGLWIHEFTQEGNPHYHGWYQVDTAHELGRVAMIKVLKKFGLIKIAKVKSSYAINNYTRQRNALGYYKKETFDKYIIHNPITKDTYDDTNWAQKLFFFTDMAGRKSINDLMDTISNKKYYTEFYKKSD